MSLKKDDADRWMSEEDESCIQAMLFVSTNVYHTTLNTAVELNLFEIIARAGPGAYVSPSEIASQLPTQNPNAPRLIDRMLRLFASHGLLSYSLRTLEDGRVDRLYGLTPACKFFLRSDDGGCLASIVTLFSHPAIREVRPHLKDVILEGGDQFQKVHGMSMFEYMDKDPTLNKAFNEAMVGRSTIIMKKIVETYQGFEGLASLVDVGGGTGASLNMIISKYPSIKGINFDLPHVVQTAPTYPGIEHVGGSMLVSIPKADAIMIKNICHNWSDEHCLKILSNCYEALPKNGKVIVIDIIMAEAPEPSMGSQYVSRNDNSMLLLHGGKERTAREFEALCKGSGFSDFRVVCYVYSFVSAVMEFQK
ncbi:Caffeic acid 3-O-methyltransferase [Vitis vinifera]|uniref:Caffeic acid 3-O-methyltransferase n=1 Tax=Vitis vinifera TaxID=29760 RepID=A0A438EMR9_VITVI|nr:Caffeic acid 3-O-methyltransferase [Vitis vinifera]